MPVHRQRLTTGAVAAMLVVCPAALSAKPADKDWPLCAAGEGTEALSACSRLVKAEAPITKALAYYDRALIRRTMAWRSRAFAERGAVAPASAIAMALADLGRAIATAPGFAPARVNRAVLRYEAGDYPGAIADADRAIVLNPTIAEAWNIRALAYLRRGEAAQATGDFDQTIRLAKNYGNAMIPRAIGPMVPDGCGGSRLFRPFPPPAP